MAVAGPLRFLITAGPTREYLDPVRFLSNDSSGRMGFALAHAAARRGHRVTLVHGPVALAPPPGVKVVPVVSAAEMLATCRRRWPRHQVLIMAAAVADYTPLRPAREKIKKSRRPLILRLRPTPDILAELSRRRRPGQIVVGFALEDRVPRRNAESKLRRKNLDAIVLNRPEAIGVERSRVEILIRNRPWEPLPLADKRILAVRIIQRVERLVTQAHPSPKRERGHRARPCNRAPRRLDPNPEQQRRARPAWSSTAP